MGSSRNPEISQGCPARVSRNVPPEWAGVFRPSERGCAAREGGRLPPEWAEVFRPLGRVDAAEIRRIKK